MSSKLLDIAKRLISVPGYTELPEKETKVAVELCAILKECGFDAQLLDYDGRYNVSATIETGVPGPHLVFCTHLDTVPPYEMENPFCGIEKNGRLYGRGAVDVRGILAAMIIGMESIREEKVSLCGKISLLAVADEESGSFGMRQEVKRGFIGDVTIVGEPTNLCLGVAHKGVCWDSVEFFGKSAHGSVPDQGRSSILDAVQFINKVQAELVPKLKSSPHPLLGAATINFGKMVGGTRPTIVPEHCEIQIDRRLIPGESSATAYREFDSILSDFMRTDSGFKATQKILLGGPEKPFPPLDSSNEHTLINKISRAGVPVLGKDLECAGLPFWTDAALAAYNTGKSAFVLGPGDIAQAHSNCEYVEILQLEQAAEIYCNIGLNICKRE